MKLKSVKVDEHTVVRSVKVIITKRDLIKVFVVICAAELVASIPISRRNSQAVGEWIDAKFDKLPRKDDTTETGTRQTLRGVDDE